MTKRILRLPSVKEKTGLGQTELYKLMNSNQFPQSVPLGKRARGWLEHEVDEWIDSKVEKRKKLARIAA